MPAAVGELRFDQPPLDELLSTLRRVANTADELGRPLPEVLDVVRGCGVLGLVIPVRYGGMGRDTVAVNRVVTDVAREDASTAIILFQHFAVSARITDWGNEEQKRTLLPRAASGEWILASAWSETGAGADKRRIATTAERQPDGGWTLDGAKSFTTGAGIADLYLVLAKSGEDEYGTSIYGAGGQSFFLVEAETPGVVPGHGLDLVGMRASATGFVQLRSCRVSADALLGPEGEATRIIDTVRESGATLGAVSVGIAEAAYDILVDHVIKRGLTSQQAIRHRIVNLATQIEAARAIVERSGRRDAADPGMTTLYSKLFASTTSETVVAEVHRMLGSTGFVRTHPVNRLGHDARAVALMGPTNDVCRELVSAQCLTKPGLT
ncbi:MAG TPA: acyl-CoA dehydrogenase family protein [Pseudonocardiaceae bacterium]|nr:acyl-CoA dehydrogenase family protein [Pseudonocardiaceae bacterium]